MNKIKYSRYVSVPFLIRNGPTKHEFCAKTCLPLLSDPTSHIFTCRVSRLSSRLVGGEIGPCVGWTEAYGVERKLLSSIQTHFRPPFPLKNYLKLFDNPKCTELYSERGMNSNRFVANSRRKFNLILQAEI